MSDYAPIIYIWLEVSHGVSTKAQFMLAKYLGGDIRHGDGFEIRSHIWLSDDDVITFRETLPHTMDNTPSAVRAYAHAVRQRIVDHVAKGLRDRRAISPTDKKEMDDILDEASV